MMIQARAAQLLLGVARRTGALGVVFKLGAVLIALVVGSAVVGALTIAQMFGASSAAAASADRCAEYSEIAPSAPSGPVELSESQQVVAAAIIAEGRRLGVPDFGLVVAIATAIQESGLNTNPVATLDNGSSLGPFQQLRAWGSAEVRRDPTLSARMFFTGGQAGQPGLLDIEGWEQMTLTQAAQAVQRSAYPDAYARHEPTARKIASHYVGAPLDLVGTGNCTLVGVADPLTTLNCPATSYAAERGLQPAALAVLRCLDMQYGQGISIYYGRGNRAANSKSDHPAGRAVDAMIIGWNGAGKATGDGGAEWLKANAAILNIRYIIWDAKIWSPARDAEGWRRYRHPSGATDPTSAHKDHIHVSVNR